MKILQNENKVILSNDEYVELLKMHEKNNKCETCIYFDRLDCLCLHPCYIEAKRLEKEWKKNEVED